MLGPESGFLLSKYHLSTYVLFIFRLRIIQNKLLFAYGYFGPMEMRSFKIVNNCLNNIIYSFLETSGGQNYNLYLNVVHFFNTSVD